MLLKALLQDLYEVKKHPTIVDGQQRVAIEVLAPNGRPVQVTDNICDFWQNSYTGIKNELKGRYPKHRWRREICLRIMRIFWILASSPIRWIQLNEENMANGWAKGISGEKDFKLITEIGDVKSTSDWKLIWFVRMRMF